jgi:ribosomal protein S18 acetylase RimI-like enzyme
MYNFLMEIVVRKYNETDLQYIKDSLEKIQDYLIDIDPIKRLRKQLGYKEMIFNKFLEDLNNNISEIFIAEDEGISIGFVAGMIFNNGKQTENELLEVIPSKSGSITDIFVEYDYRNKGVGKQLMSEIEKFLINEGCDAIWVHTNGFNKQSIGFYKSLGFSERDVALIKKTK